ncbi:GNAT family N-acetyltransferase [Pareuzebyella sediminis]|uniref:GNAT family N-acetyltransferase n=1 Tax=Pareuzebyella sediminis TaxID=2607998 RepID=UPI0011EBB29C|nr:GNAT family N-acetyltransferase [Pareuzebyella sediminis]
MEISDIETSRLKLRPLNESDWKMVSFLRSDKQVNKFINRPIADTKETAIAFISKINTGIKTNEWYYWAIELKASNTVIGTICLWNFSDDGKVAETGFDLHPNFQGNGFMSEALQSILDFGFEQLQLNTILAFTHFENINAQRLLKQHKFKKSNNTTESNNAIRYLLKNTIV